ncbi:hypothetical protein DL93DRAFT_547607 [Clavulina sp. PMI_390]|nr:hypothetical protein DL93DRAFT_547607 [Clavulina sp. PMI_390]
MSYRCWSGLKILLITALSKAHTLVHRHSCRRSTVAHPVRSTKARQAQYIAGEARRSKSSYSGQSIGPLVFGRAPCTRYVDGVLAIGFEPAANPGQCTMSGLATHPNPCQLPQRPQSRQF